MKCLHCGSEQSHYLCDECLTEEILDKVFYEIIFFKPDVCSSPYIVELVSKQTEKYAERAVIPEILDLFSVEISSFYACRYGFITKAPTFECDAIDFISAHDLGNKKTQRVLYDLLELYLRNDFIKPRRWCDHIIVSDNLCYELYASAAQYFSMVGEYDLAEKVLNKATAYCEEPAYCEFLKLPRDKAVDNLAKLKNDLQRYRTKKPYWPNTEERRRAVAMFYDEKGITYPRIENRPQKVSESEFEPINESFDERLPDYCAFWCSEAFSVTASKCIYQIAAVKVRGGVITDTFESYIRPWDAGSSARKAAAKEIDVSVETIECAPDVDLAMKDFFAFVENDTLVSTSALGNQAKLISRAARYAGMRKIENEFFDLLDLAADTSSDFDMSNNTREYLLSHFSIAEGKTALEKAKANKALYDALVN